MKRRTIKGIITAICIIQALNTSCEVGLGSAVDTQAPGITIERPAVDLVIRDKFVMSGEWNDDGVIDSVYVIIKRTDENPVNHKGKDGAAQEEIRIDGSFEKDLLEKEKGTWKAEVDPFDEANPIPDGKYQATIYIKDKGNHTTSQNTTFTVDNTPPVLILKKPASKPGDSTISKYGKRLFLEGQVADTTKETWIEIKFYNKADCSEESLLSTMQTQLIAPTDVNSNNAKLASFSEDLGDELAREYFDIYKDENGGDKNGKEGASTVYAALTVYDTAETCKEESGENTEAEVSGNGKVRGNSTGTFYFSKELSSSITKSRESGGYGLAPTDIYNILNGNYEMKDSSRATEAQKVTDELKELRKDREGDKDITVFTINPENSPYFTVSGLKTLSDLSMAVSDNGYFLINGAMTLEISVFMGSDSIEIDSDSEDFYAYLLESDEYGEPLENAEQIKLYSKARESGSGKNKKTYYEIGGKEELLSTTGAYVFSVPMAKTVRVDPDKTGNDGIVATGIEYGKNYVIRVSGKDMEDNPIEVYDTGYGFHFTSGGGAPELEIKEPHEGTLFIKKGEGVTFSGRAKTEEGVAEVTVWNGETKLTDLELLTKDDGVFNDFSGSVGAEKFDQENGGIYTLTVKAAAGGDNEGATEYQRTIWYDVEEPKASNIKVSEKKEGDEAYKDSYTDGQNYFVNNKKKIISISGIATDNVGLESAVLKVSGEGGKEIEKTETENPGKWSFEGIDLRDWSGEEAEAELILEDKSGNKSSTKLFIKFDVTAPEAEHKIDDSLKNLEFRIGDAANDAGQTGSEDPKDKDVGGKYSNGSYGSALTMQLRGNFPDNAGGSGINKFYYKTFNNQEVKIDSSITGSDPVVGTGENEGKIFFKDDAALIAYVVANKTDVFSPIAVETRNVEYNIGPYEPETWVTVPTASVRFGGSATTTANASGQYKSNKKGYVQFRTSVDTNFKTTMKDFVEGKNYLVIVAQDNAGNLGLDTATVAGVEYPCYSLNVDITAPTIPTKQSGTVYTNLAGSTPVNISGTVSDKSSSEYGSSGLNKIVFTSDQTDAKVTVSSSAFTAVDASENPNNDPTLKRWTADIRSLLNADGTAIISAKVSDNAGYETSVPVANVMVDSTAPAVIINSPAANAKTGTTVSISGTVNDGTGSGIDTTKPMILYYTKNATKGLAGLDVADISGLGSDASAGWVKLDEFTPGSNGIWNYELNAENITAAGENNIRFFTVSATDKAGSGNTGIAEAVRITVDRKAPVSSEFKVDETEGTSLGSDTTIWFKNSTVNLNGTFTDQGGSGLSAVKYQLKKGSAEYETTQNVASDGSFSVNVKDLIDGINKIKVWSADAAGNTSAEDEYTVMVDSKTPVITTNYTGVIPANESACIINLTVTDDGSSGINKVQLKIGDNTVDCDLIDASTGAYSKDVMDILPQGTVSVTAIATDNAGNSTSSVIANVMLDTEGPVVTITSPSANAKIGATVTVTGTADDRTGAGVDTTKNLILYYTTDETTGNVTTAPASITTSDDASAGWKAYNTTQILEEDGQNWSCIVDVTTLGTLFPEDADTPVWFTVMATDKSGDGNKGYAIPRKAIVDRIKPAFDDSNSGVSGTKGVTVVSGKWFDATTLNIFGKFEDTTTGSGVKTIWYKLGNADDVSIATTDGTYNTNIQGFAAGTNTLKIWAVDAAGNQSDEITYTVKVDTIAPDLTESGIGTTGKTTNAGFTLSGKAWDANQLSRIEIKLGSQTWVSGTDSNISLTPETSEPASSNWTATFVTGSSNSSAENYVEDGTKDFTVTVYDVAGLSKQVSRTVVVDTQKPEIGTVSVSEVGGVTIDGNIWYKTTSVPVTVPVTDQGISGVSKVEYAVQSGNSATWTPLSYDGTNYTGTINFAGNGTQTLRLKATDVAGNVSTESTVSVNIDTSAPDLTALYYKKETGAAEAVSSPVYLKTGTQITVYGNYKDEQSGVNALTFKMGDTTVTPTVSYSTTEIGNSAPSDSSFGTYASITDKTAIRSWKVVYTPTASGRFTAEGSNRTNTTASANVFEITIDTAVPAISNVKLTEVKTGVANKDAYKNGNSFYVNSSGKTFTVSGIATDDIGVDSVSLSIAGTTTITPTRTGTLGQWIFAGIDLSSWSGTGTATVTVTDKAGNVTTESFGIVFDAAAPVSKTIKINNQTENLTTRWYDSESLSLSGSYEDTGSGVARVYYKLGSTGTEKSLTPVYNETSHYYDYSTTIDFTGVTDRKLYIRAEDNAGNLMSDYTQYSLNIDIVSPELTETGIGTAGKTTNTGFSLTGKAWDANQLSRIEIKLGSQTWVSGTDSNVSLTAATSEPASANWTASFVTGSGNSSAENYVADGTKEFTITAYDVAGLPKQVTRTVVVDTVLPDADEPSITSKGNTTYVSVTPAGTENPSEKGWYESDGSGGYVLSSDVTVDSGKTYYTKQTWFNSTFINIKVENVKDEGGTGISKVEYSKDNGTNWSQMSGSGTTYTATVNCDKQGENTIQVKVTDAAENETVAGSVTAYVDTKEPSLENSFAKYLTGDYEAVSELLINGDNGYDIKISAKDEEGGTGANAGNNSGIASVQYSYGSYTINGTKSGNDWVITVPKTGNGTNNYSDTGSNKIYVIIKDNAGNEVKERVLTVTKDTTAPTVEIKSFTRAGSKTTVSGTELDDVNGTITISGLADDTNRFGSVKLEYQKDGESSWTPIPTTSSTSWTTTLNTTTLTDNAKYTIKATATDAAGNTAEDTQVVYVNQDSDRPVITVTNMTLSNTETSYLKRTSRLEGTVSDDDGNVTKLEYSTNGTTWTEATLEYGTAWSISELPEGDNKLYFRVTDSVNATPFTTAVEVESATKEAAGQPKIKDASNTYVTHTQGSLALKFKVVTKQPDVDEKKYQVYNSSTSSWEERDNLGTLGGVYTKFKISLKAKSDAFIANVKAKYTTDSYDIEFTPSETTTPYNYPADKNLHLWTSPEIALDATKTEIKLKISDASSTTDPMTLEQTVTYAVDNTAPTIKIKEPSSTAGVKETMQFDLSEDATAYYAVTRKYKLNDQGGETTTECTAEDVAEWTVIQDTSNGLTRYVFFDDDLNEKDHTERFALYLTEKSTNSKHLGITTLSLIEATTNPYEDITPVKFWVKAVDSCGNTATKDQLVNVDPQGNRPTVTLGYPIDVLKKDSDTEYENPTLGGTIRMDGNVSDDIAAKYVWVQIERGENAFSVADLKFLSTEGYPIGDMKTNNLIDDDDIQALTAGTEAATYAIANYAIRVEPIGTSWNLSINSNQEFNVDNDIANLKFKIYATDADPDKVTPGIYHIHRSGVVEQEIKIDSRTPYISASELKLVKYESASTSEKQYKEDTSVHGIWYLQGTIRDDDSGLKLIKYKRNSDNYTPETEVIKSAGTEWTSESDEHFYFKKVEHSGTGGAGKYDYKFSIPLGNNTSGQVGKDKITIYAEEATDQNYKVEQSYTVTYDNMAPVFKTTDSPFIKLSSDIYNSSGFYTFGAIASEDEVKVNGVDVPQSGVERIAFYFTRDLNYGLNELDEDVYTEHSGTTTKDLFDVMIYHSNVDADDVASGNMIVGYNSLTYSDGLYWRTYSGTSSGKTFTYTNNTVDYNIHAGGLVKINGVIYKIISVSGKTITVGSDITGTSADFALCNVIDNSGEKNGTSISSDHGYGFGYYGTRATDDGDLITETFNSQNTEWIFDASINSKNLPDGPITLHMVAFDKAGNVTTTPFTMNGTVKNNAPRIAGLILGTDENGNGTVDSGEFVNTYSGKFTKGYDTAGNEMHDVTFPVVPDGGTQTSLLTVKGLTVVKPEIIGGNGAISYKYKVGSGTEVDGGALDKNGGGTVSGTTDDVVTGYIELPVSAFIGTTNGADGNVIPDGDLSEFKFTFGDSTPGTSLTDTAGKNSASVTVFLDVALRETNKAKNWILPFYWKSKTDNSLFNQSSAEGHIELAEDWVTTTSFTGTSGEYDADPKVSGRIKIEGIAQDDTLLREIKVQFGTSMGGLGTDNSAIATYNAAGGSWTVTALENDGSINSTTGWASAVQQATYQELKDVGIITAIPDDKEATSKVPYTSQDYGHVVHWILYLDTALVDGVAATDVKVTATATDRGKPNWNASANEGNGGVDYNANTAFVTGDTEGENETIIPAANSGAVTKSGDDVNIGTRTGRYRMDFVPYITEVVRGTDDSTKPNKFNTNRARSGAVSLRRGDVLNKIKGFNLNGDSVSVKITSNKNGSGTAVTMADVTAVNDITFTVSDSTTAGFAKSGYLHVEVNNIATLNNINGYKDYNTETNAKSYDHNTLTDDRYVHIWRVNKQDTFKGSKNAVYPAMARGRDGTLYASFTNYGQSKTYYTKSFIGTGTVTVSEFNGRSGNSRYNYQANDAIQTTTNNGANGVATIFWGYDPPEETDISVDSNGNVNVFYAANYHGGSNTAWGGTEATQAGGIYVYDTNATSTLINDNGTSSKYAKMYRSELYTYDDELNQFKNIRITRNGNYIYLAYYDRLRGSIKASVIDDSETPDTTDNGLPWVTLDGDYDDIDNGGSNVSFAGGWKPFLNTNYATGLTRTNATGESVAITTNSNGYPVVFYMDAETGCLRIATASKASPTTANDWRVQGVFSSTDDNYDTASDYMSCLADSQGYLHIAFQNTKGQLVYAKSKNNPSNGTTAYDFSDGSQVLDDSGMYIDMTMNGTTPYISYLSRANSYDGMKIAFKDSNFDENNDGVAEGGWETMTAALNEKVTTVRTCIEPNAKAYDTNSYTAAVGFCPGLDYRAAFYVGK